MVCENSEERREAAAAAAVVVVVCVVVVATKVEGAGDVPGWWTAAVSNWSEYGREGSAGGRLVMLKVRVRSRTVCGGSRRTGCACPNELCLPLVGVAGAGAFCELDANTAIVGVEIDAELGGPRGGGVVVVRQVVVLGEVRLAGLLPAVVLLLLEVLTAYSWSHSVRLALEHALKRAQTANTYSVARSSSSPIDASSRGSSSSSSAVTCSRPAAACDAARSTQGDQHCAQNKRREKEVASGAPSI